MTPVQTTEAPRKDPFRSVVWNHSYIEDWSDPGWDADTITAELLGSFDYRDLPEFDGMMPVEIERKILFDAGRPNWGKRSKYGKPHFRHMLSLLAEMLPETDITPDLADCMMLFCMGIGGADRKMLNLIGAQDMGKSAFGCRIIFVVMYIDPEFSAAFVANPFDNAADSTAWGDIEEIWDQLKEAHPHPTNTETCSLFPKAIMYRLKELHLVPNLPKTGRIVLRNVKNVGKFKGAKSRGKNVHRGVMLLYVDEVNEIENPSFMKMLNNIAGQDAFFAVTSQNFKDPEDMGGQIAEPKATFGGPATYEELDIETDKFWHSAHSSVTLRLDGHKSPNILAGRDIYPKLFREKTRRRLEDDYGMQSPDYFSQARSFPVQGDDTNSVLSKAQLHASRFDDEARSVILDVTFRVAFVDPAFGGRDKVVWGWAESSNTRITDAEGTEHTMEILHFKEHFQVIQLVKGATFDLFWEARMKKIGLSTANFDIGKPLTYEEQIAIRSAELCRERGIPFTHFGYDFSMRPDIVTAVNKVMGFGPKAYDYNTPPEGGHVIQRFKMQSEDCCKNRISELAFMASDIFFSKQVRGGDNIQTACTQLIRTRYETKQGKKLVEGKKEYKDRWQQVSPDHRDVLMGICGMAFSKGFRKNSLGDKPKGTSYQEFYATIAASKKVKPTL